MADLNLEIMVFGSTDPNNVGVGTLGIQCKFTEWKLFTSLYGWIRRCEFFLLSGY